MDFTKNLISLGFPTIFVGVRFLSITNGCATHSSEEWKLRNCFNGDWYSVHFRMKNELGNCFTIKKKRLALVWYLPNGLRCLS